VEEWTILTPKSEDADGINEKNNSDYGNTWSGSIMKK
jgi:hypothetical protein